MTVVEGVLEAPGIVREEAQLQDVVDGTHPLSGEAQSVVYLATEQLKTRAALAKRTHTTKMSESDSRS